MRRIFIPVVAAALALPAAAENISPELSLILQGQYRRGKNVPERAITGYWPAGHAHAVSRRLTLDETELIAAAQLGSADRWQQSWDLNRDRVADEDLIYPKLVLLMP